MSTISMPLSIFTAGRLVIVLPHVVGTAWYWIDDDAEEYFDEDEIEDGYEKRLAVYHSAPATPDDHFDVNEPDGMRLIAQLAMYYEIVEGNRKP